jgi:geranylgeranyl pyrophosphate synthase
MDDLLDIVGDPAKGAQARLSDIREHQHTFFTQYVFDHGTPQQGRKLNSWLGSPIAEPEIPTVAALFEETGALTAGRSRIISRLEDAKQCLKAVPDGAVASRKLSGLIDLLAARLV